MLLMIIFGILFIILLWFRFKNKRQSQTYEKRQPQTCEKRQPQTYEDLLLTPEWKSKRGYILKRDNYKCQWCGKQEQLQVHHKYYSKYPNNVKVQPWNYPNDALITLCDECHQKAHKKKIKVYYRKYTENY